MQDIDVTDTDVLPDNSERFHGDSIIKFISDVLSRCNNLKNFRCVGLNPLPCTWSDEYASWNVADPLPSRVLKILAMNPRISGFNLRLVSPGSTEASNYMKLLIGSSKITKLQILLECEYSEMTLSHVPKAYGVNDLLLVYLFILKGTQGRTSSDPATDIRIFGQPSANTRLT